MSFLDRLRRGATSTVQKAQTYGKSYLGNTGAKVDVKLLRLKTKLKNIIDDVEFDTELKRLKFMKEFVEDLKTKIPKTNTNKVTRRTKLYTDFIDECDSIITQFGISNNNKIRLELEKRSGLTRNIRKAAATKLKFKEKLNGFIKNNSNITANNKPGNKSPTLRRSVSAPIIYEMSNGNLRGLTLNQLERKLINVPNNGAYAKRIQAAINHKRSSRA